jgi:hypothetical protein
MYHVFSILFTSIKKLLISALRPLSHTTFFNQYYHKNILRQLYIFSQKFRLAKVSSAKKCNARYVLLFYELTLIGHWKWGLKIVKLPECIFIAVLSVKMSCVTRVWKWLRILQQNLQELLKFYTRRKIWINLRFKKKEKKFQSETFIGCDIEPEVLWN